jgi:hypothetical protein
VAQLPNPEICLAAAVVALAFAAAHWRWRWLGWWERPLAAIARRKRLAIVIAALLPLAVRAILLLRFPVPQPHVHDEFTFLLAADTFAHGRLVNPQHPLWPLFESIHILVRPVYASVFPIAPAAALALGQTLFGHPWAGVWLSVAFMCAAVCWALQGCLPARWAFTGAVLLILRLAVSSYWMNSYWGGAVAAGGGALVLGSLLRARRTPRWRYAALSALGLAILANSRPVEGAVYGLAVAVALCATTPWSTLRRIAVPLVPLLGLAVAGMGYYFARVTGKPWVVPYVLYRDSISLAPHFLWQQPRPEPLYNNSVMRHFYANREMEDYRQARRLLSDLPRKAVYWRFYLGPLLVLPLVALPGLWRDRRTRPLVAIAAGFCLVLVVQVWHNPHYAAPATGLVFLIVSLALRRLRTWRARRRPVGLCLVRLIPVASAAMLAIQIVAHPAYTDQTGQASWRWPSAGNTARAAILQQLKRAGGRHLVFLRYQPAHDPGEEWVYNAADIDASPVVWARELDRETNASAIRYFAGRRVWLMEPDAVPPRLRPYEDASAVLMPFVQVGAPGIAAIRFPGEVLRRMTADSSNPPGAMRTCDQWNFYFSRATGVNSHGPDGADPCFAAGNREQLVSFDHWFVWLQRQH